MGNIAELELLKREAAGLASLDFRGGFIEVHVATPAEACEGCDSMGLYAQASADVINEFTGISDPCEAH